MGPVANLNHAHHAPQHISLLPRILQALLDLYPLVSLDVRPKHRDVFDWRKEGLVAAAVLIVHIFANNAPLLLIEGGAAKNHVGVDKAVEDEPVCEALAVFSVLLMLAVWTAQDPGTPLATLTVVGMAGQWSARKQADSGRTRGGLGADSGGPGMLNSLYFRCICARVQSDEHGI
jgi:hypothetical protein